MNRFIPNPRGLRASLAEFSYDWRRALVKEYGTICFALLSLVDPAGLENCLGLRLRRAQGDDSTTVRGCVPVLIFYGIVRYLKITKRLRPARKEETEEAIAGG